MTDKISIDMDSNPYENNGNLSTSLSTFRAIVTLLFGMHGDDDDECQEEMNSLLKLIDELEALSCANEDGSKDDEIAEKLTSFQHRLSRGDFPDDSD